MQQEYFKTIHNLEFKEEDSWIERLISNICNVSKLNTKIYYIGTCKGQYFIKDKKVILLSILNDEPHNGHFIDVLQYFCNMAINKKYDFVIGSIMNERLYNHFIKKGFEPCKKYNGLILKYGFIKKYMENLCNN